ncbi:hypothetical protein J2S20_002404 [Moryella indoligenes]|uniref:Uncharacterized protein n=1 Tax=Moryella indoligenes TaxID=371674 RepID=A0AAE3VCP1_9FIRM|nr:hypothetical protein [Moryella indoligenes]MDQ0153682.1 hypothetical protein [Moryella indoligenes]
MKPLNKKRKLLLQEEQEREECFKRQRMRAEVLSTITLIMSIVAIALSLYVSAS